jgi:putative endonuclease
LSSIALATEEIYNLVDVYYVYLLTLSNNEIYTGSTSNLKTRISDHQEGKNISTKPFRPVKLIDYCAFPSKKQAIKFEVYLKSGSGKAFRNRHLI